MGRKFKPRVLPKRILVLCEGESEQIYLNGLKRERFAMNRLCAVDIEMYQPNDYSPFGMVKEAWRRIKEANRDRYPYFSVWVVFDKDAHENIDVAFGFSNDNNINVAFSNICFEFWILMHYEKTCRHFENSKKLISYIEKKHLVGYSKKMDLYETLKCKIPAALENCKWLRDKNSFELDCGKNPYELGSYTNFDRLYEFICDMI